MSESDIRVCHTCNEQVVTGQVVQFQQYSFHPEHFICTICNESLVNSKFGVYEDQFYCEKDHIRKLAKICDYCKEPIISGKVSLNILLYHLL